MANEGTAARRSAEEYRECLITTAVALERKIREGETDNGVYRGVVPLEKIEGYRLVLADLYDICPEIQREAETRARSESVKRAEASV